MVYTLSGMSVGWYVQGHQNSSAPLHLWHERTDPEAAQTAWDPHKAEPWQRYVCNGIKDRVPEEKKNGIVYE